MNIGFTLASTTLDLVFASSVSDPILLPLKPVIEGLMAFLPEDRITASEALMILNGW